MDAKPPTGRLRRPIHVAAAYLAVATLWLFSTERLVLLLTAEAEPLTWAQTVKDVLFASVSAFFFYLVLRREIESCRMVTGHLHKSRQELLDILDALPVGIVLTDGKTIEYININFSERFGYSLDEIPTDEQWFLLACPDDTYRNQVVGAWRSEVEKAQAGRKPIRPLEVKVTCKNGQVRQVIANTQIIGNRIVIILTDITEREMLHNELIKMQKLESIGVLAGGIAHDFNNILTGIMGNISYARLLLDPSHPVRESLDDAEQASKRAAELTRQLLTFARGGEPIKTVVAVGRLINEAATLMLRGTGVRGEVRIDGSVRAIEADAGQIAQVLNNVIINAIQAMPEGGILGIMAGNDRVDANNTLALAEGDYVRITIADQGCGIPAEALERIFDPYFTTKDGGSGLGLASAYSIVSRHGGHIGVASTPGQGTICTILLPATDKIPPADKVEAAGPDTPERRADRPVVLVMDDEAVIRNLAATMLSHLGYAVRTCADGQAAVDLYLDSLNDSSPFAAVLLDLTVPGGMGGLEAARRILDLDDKARLIVSSGYSDDPVMASHAAHGFCGVLAKPYTMVELGQVLHTVLAQRQTV